MLAKSFHTPQVQTSFSHSDKFYLRTLSLTRFLKFPFVFSSSGLQRQDSGHWWSSFFFPNKQNQPGGMIGSEQKSGTYTVTNGQVACIAREMVLKKQLSRQLSESSDSGKVEQGSPPPS
uniref:Pancreatic progenitor cell differentiation and proliferation factor a n=1 Tax=Salmo trutta TaxID=8032 RepID=A0A673XV34_SALTR